MRNRMKNAFVQFKINLRYAKKMTPGGEWERPKFEFVSTSIQKLRDGMKRNSISESYM